jgi:hypothetical protein
MDKINCCIIAGPNSDKFIKLLIPICELFSNNKLIWYLCIDKFNDNNDFSFLNNKDNITKLYFKTKFISGGDRHGVGINKIIKYFKNDDKIIILEPDSFPCIKNWDNILLSKLNNEVCIVSMLKKKYLDKDFKESNNLDYIRNPISGDFCFYALNPKILFNIKATFTKIKIEKKYKKFINFDIEKLGNKRILLINDDNLSNIFKLNKNTIMQKETGWRVAYYLHKHNLKHKNLETKWYFYDKNKKPIDLIFFNNSIFGFHIRHSRFFDENNISYFYKILKNIFKYYNLSKKNILKFFI